MAVQTASKQPNLFELSGDGIHVSFSTSGFDGKPHFSYHDANVNKQFVGDQIRTEQTVLGTLASVTLVMIPDAGSTTFTALIPTVNLRGTDSANVASYGITTLHKSSIIGAPLGQGEFYTPHAMQGTAMWVVF